MAFLFHDEVIEVPILVDGQYTASGALGDRKGVIFSAERTVALPTAGGGYHGLNVAGITYDSYADGDLDVHIIRQGRCRYTSYGVHAIGDPLTLYSSAGAFRKALPGEYAFGKAVRAVATSTNYGLGEFNFLAPFIVQNQFQARELAMTDDSATTLDIPAGTYSIEIYYKNLTANAIAAGIDIGTTDGGAEIISAGALAASTAYHVEPDACVALTYDLTAGDIIYFTDTSGGWNSASVTATYIFRQVY